MMYDGEAHKHMQDQAVKIAELQAELAKAREQALADRSNFSAQDKIIREQSRQIEGLRSDLKRIHLASKDLKAMYDVPRGVILEAQFQDQLKKLIVLSSSECDCALRDFAQDIISKLSQPDERDGVILKMQEALELEKQIEEINSNHEKEDHQPEDCCHCGREIVWLRDKYLKMRDELIALPLPATSKHYEALVKVAEAAKNLECCSDEKGYHDCGHSDLNKALAELDALKTFEVPRA